MSSTTLTCYSDIALASSRSGSFSPTASYMPGGYDNFAGVFMSFSVPSMLKAKKITKATLRFFVAPYVYAPLDFIEGLPEHTMNYQSGVASVKAYTGTTAAESLLYESYQSAGSVTGLASGNFGAVTAFGGGSSSGGHYPAQSFSTSECASDITDLFKNNVYNDNFTAVITLGKVATYIYNGSTLMSIVSRYPSVVSKNAGSTATITVEYEDVIPTNENLYPNNSYIDQNTDVEFVWSFNSSSGTALAHSKVEWSTDQSVWNSIFDRDGTETSYKALGIRFPAGKVYWRITTTDSLGVSASPSIASWTVMAAPDAPVILGATEEAQPTITWNASSQMAYSIKIFQNGTLKESEEVSKQTKSYKCKEFYEADAVIEIRLKVMNQYEMWSEEVSRVFVFNMEQPAAAQLSVLVNGPDVKVIVKTEEEATMYLFRHDYESGCDTNLGIITSEMFDRFAPSNKRISYFVRTVTKGYRDSAIVSAVVKINGINLYCNGSSLNLELCTENFMPLDDKHGRDSVLAYYAGRKYPCRELGEKYSHEITRTFFLPEKDLQTFAKMAISDEPIIYRDNRGNVMLAALVSDLTAVAYLKTGYTVQCTFEQIEEG